MPHFSATEIIENTSGDPIEAWFEPWGMSHTLPAGGSFRVEAVSERPGQLEVERQGGRVAVYAWPGCTMRVYSGDLLIDDFTGKVPDTPPGMSTRGFLRLMLGGARGPSPAPAPAAPGGIRRLLRFFRGLCRR